MSYEGGYDPKGGSMRTATEGFEIVCIVSVIYKYLFEMCEAQQVPLNIDNKVHHILMNNIKK